MVDSRRGQVLEQNFLEFVEVPRTMHTKAILV